jgi:hypothetical protein
MNKTLIIDKELFNILPFAEEENGKTNSKHS